MALRTTGPVVRQHTIGNVRYWNLEAFNNTPGTVNVTFRVLNLNDSMNVEIASMSKPVGPGLRQSFLIDVGNAEYTMAIVEYPVGRNDVLANAAGLDEAMRQIPGATFSHNLLIDVKSLETFSWKKI